MPALSVRRSPPRTRGGTSCESFGVELISILQRGQTKCCSSGFKWDLNPEDEGVEAPFGCVNYEKPTPRNTSAVRGRAKLRQTASL